MREAMPETPLSFLTTGMRFISWEVASHELMEFAFRLLVNRGIRRFAVMDPMNTISAMTTMADLTRKAGGESIVAALTFTLSPLHDDAHFAKAAEALASSGKFDRLYLKDPGGLVSPERACDVVSGAAQGGRADAAGVPFGIRPSPWRNSPIWRLRGRTSIACTRPLRRPQRYLATRRGLDAP